MPAELIGVGLATLDHLVVVDSFSSPAGELRVKSFDIQGGGLIGTALVAASRLGIHPEIWTQVGSGKVADWILEGLAAEGIDTSRVRKRTDTDGSVVIVLIDGRTGERRFAGGWWLRGEGPYPMELERIGSARCVLVDGIWPKASAEAARYARSRGVPVVADLSSVEGPQRAVAESTDFLIVDETCARRLVGGDDPEEAVRALRSLGARVAVVTAGARGAWYSDGAAVEHREAFKVEVVDTTGAGDCFHGAFAAGVIRGWELRRTVEFASAAAALKCRSLGGRAGLPRTGEVEEFIRKGA